MEFFDIEEDINEFLNGGSGVAINCATLEDAKKFLQILNEYNVKWSSSKENLYNPRWNSYKEKTCYVCDKTLELSYGSIPYLRNSENYKILQ